MWTPTGPSGSLPWDCVNGHRVSLCSFLRSSQGKVREPAGAYSPSPMPALAGNLLLLPQGWKQGPQRKGEGERPRIPSFLKIATPAPFPAFPVTWESSSVPVKLVWFVFPSLNQSAGQTLGRARVHPSIMSSAVFQHSSWWEERAPRRAGDQRQHTWHVWWVSCAELWGGRAIVYLTPGLEDLQASEHLST